MSVQDLFVPTQIDLKAVRSAPFSFFVGAVLAVLLIWGTQGTQMTQTGPKWHGNVAVGGSLDRRAQEESADGI